MRLPRLGTIPRLRTVYLVGFGFAWGWYDFFRVSGSHLMPGSGGTEATMTPERILISLGCNLGLILVVILRRHIYPLGRQKILLMCSAAVMSLGTSAIYMDLLGVAVVPYTEVIGFTIGLFDAVLVLAWFEMLSSIGGIEARTALAGALLTNALVCAAIWGVTEVGSPSVTMILHACLPWVSLACLRRCWALPEVSRSADPAIQTRPFRMPTPLIIGVFIYGVAFGMMMNASRALSAGRDVNPGIELAGIAVAAVLFFCLSVLPTNGTSRHLSLRPVTMPLVMGGFILLPFIGYLHPLVASAVTWVGYDYLDLLMMTVYIELSYRVPAPSLAVNGWGQFIDTFGTTIGLVVASLFFDYFSPTPSQLSSMTTIAVFIVATATLWFMDDRKLATLWGLAKLPARQLKEGRIAERVRSLTAIHGLTSREQEVLLLLLDGKRAEQIAQELVVSISTIRTHIHRVYDKLGVHSHGQLLDLVDRR